MIFFLVSSVYGEKVNRFEKFCGGEKRGLLSNLGNFIVCLYIVILICKLKIVCFVFNFVCVWNYRVKN